MNTVTVASEFLAVDAGPELEFHSGSVEVVGFSVRYFEAGAGDPLIVLHGAGGPEITPALHTLARGRRVVVIEMPGFGAQPNEQHQTLAEFAQAVAQAIEAIGVPAYHLLGSSFGGAVALHIALAHPDRVSSLVLEAPALFRVGAADPHSMDSAEEERRRFRVNPDREPVWQPPDPVALARVWGLVQRVLPSTPAEEEKLVERLQQCAVRTLVVFGDRDGVIPPENGRTYRRLMPNCSLVFVHQAAHQIQADRPEAFSELVGDFLDRGWQFLLPDDSTLINP